MAKISANTITDGSFPRVAAATVSPSLFTGAASHIGAALGAGARTIEVENEGIRDLTRQRVGNIEARSREMRGAIENLGRGVSGMLKGFDSALDKRADEEAEAAMGKYRLALLAGQAEDDATPVKGSLSAGLGDADAMARADGPYNAVRRRMSAWNDTDDYKNLSARARRKFEEKRKAVDQRFGERALEKHIAADLARRDAEAGAAISAAISEASAFACQPDKEDLDWLSSATEAIGQSVKRTFEKANLLDANGRVVEGAEELAALVRAQMADMVYSQIFGDMAASLAQTNNQETADKLRMRMYALCGSKAGVDLEKGGFNVEGLDKKQLAEIDGLFKNSAKGYEFSDAAAKKGWADFGKAWEARDRRLKKEADMADAAILDNIASATLELFSGDSADYYERLDSIERMGDGIQSPARRLEFKKNMEKTRVAADIEYFDRAASQTRFEEVVNGAPVDFASFRQTLKELEMAAKSLPTEGGREYAMRRIVGGRQSLNAAQKMAVDSWLADLKRGFSLGIGQDGGAAGAPIGLGDALAQYKEFAPYMSDDQRAKAREGMSALAKKGGAAIPTDEEVMMAFSWIGLKKVGGSGKNELIGEFKGERGSGDWHFVEAKNPLVKRSGDKGWVIDRKRFDKLDDGDAKDRDGYIDFRNADGGGDIRMDYETVQAVLDALSEYKAAQRLDPKVGLDWLRKRLKERTEPLTSRSILDAARDAFNYYRDTWDIFEMPQYIGD